MRFFKKNLGLLKYIAVRLFWGLVIVFAASFITFSLIHLAPGDPVAQMLGYRITPELYAETRAFLGLDQPIHIQYAIYMSKFLRFDFGRSILTGQVISDMIIARLPATLTLGIAGLLLSIAIAIPIGVYSALKPNKEVDTLTRTGSLFMLSMPPFWWALLLIFVFSLSLGLLPIQGRGTPPDIQHLILPAITLASAQAAITARLTRASMLEELNKDYIRTARAKGLSERTVIFKHALRNALPTVLIDIGHRAAVAVIGGAVAIEVVFAWPGMGRLMFQSLIDRDYLVIQPLLFIMALVTVISNIIFDLLIAYLDPRIRKGMM